MKIKMTKNSLFAILLRSPWWISMAIVALFALASGALLPPPYVAYGVMGGLPFLVIGIMAAWRQMRAPSAASVAEALSRAGAMSWHDFSGAMSQGFARQGYVVTRLNGPAADFSLLKGGRTTLVSCKRWKAANQGVDALRDLVAARGSLEAHQASYISLSRLTDKARRFAQEQGIHLLTDNELAQLISGKTGTG